MSNKTMDIGIPTNIEISNNFQHLRIIRKWFTFKIILLTLFVVVWDTFFLYSYPRAYITDNFFVLFSLLHVTVNLGLTYYVLAGYLNKTVIDVDFNSLVIKHGPIPLWGSKDLSTQIIKQLYCKKDDPSGDRYPLYKKHYITDSGYSYSVHVITIDRKNIKLLSGLDSREQALFIKQEIEKFLSIEDKPVKGELR